MHKPFLLNVLITNETNSNVKKRINKENVHSNCFVYAR